jgi:predicted nucleotidyltransferase
MVVVSDETVSTDLKLLLKELVAWAQAQQEIMALYLYDSHATGNANALSDVDVAVLAREGLSRQQLWRLEDRWATRWPEMVEMRVLNLAPLPFRYEVTAYGRRLWAADLGAVADFESLGVNTGMCVPAWSEPGSTTSNRSWSSKVNLNVGSIRQRLQRLEQYIAELEKQQSLTLETFRNDLTRQLAVERALALADNFNTCWHLCQQPSKRRQLDAIQAHVVVITGSSIPLRNPLRASAQWVNRLCAHTGLCQFGTLAIHSP